MAKRDPNKFEVKGNPSIWVTIARHSRDGDHDKDAFWHYVFYHQSKRYRGSTGKLEHGDAATVAISEAEKVRDFKPSAAGGLTLKQAINQSLAERWPNEHEAAEKDETVANESYSDARGRLYAWANCIGDDTTVTGLEFDAHTDLVQRYINQRKADGVSGRTIKNDQLVISNFYSWMMKRMEGGKKTFPQLKSNPAQRDLLTMPPVITRKLPDLNEAERKALFAVARDSELWPVIVLCIGAGFRPKGACTSPWSKFDLERGIFIVTEKNDEREVPLSKWAWTELKGWKASHAPATASQTVWPYHHDTAHDVLSKLRTKHGLSARTTLQALRRTADTLLYAAGVNPQDAAGIMGHTVQTAERHYVRFKQTERKHVAALDFTETPTASQTASQKGRKKRRTA